MKIYINPAFEENISKLPSNLQKNARISEGKRIAAAKKFLTKARLHPNHKNKKYNYEKAIYYDCFTCLDVYCPTHEIIFSVRPTDHLAGIGCKLCTNDHKRKIKTAKAAKKFIPQAQKHPKHKNKNYGYEKSIYIDSKTPIQIWCPNHKKYFWITPNNHLQGKGCKECGHEETNKKQILKAKLEFEQKAKIHPNHKNKNYGYNNVIYINAKTHVLIYCPKHGNFSQTPDNHLHGYGCPFCPSMLESNGEIIINSYLKEHNIDFKRQVRLEKCKNIKKLSFDFGIYDLDNHEKLKALIEFNGAQHYKPFKYLGGEKSFSMIQKRDHIKLSYCKQNNIPLLIIPYTQQKQIPEILQNFLNSI